MTSLPFSSHYIPGFIDGDDDALFQLVQQESMHHYLFRGQRMVRAPKNEFYYPENEDKTYKWGQQKLMYPGGKEYTGKVMPPLMVDMADLIHEQYGERVNHAIIIMYDDARRTHAPPHQDKVPEGTSFFVLSFGVPRRFDVLAQAAVPCYHDKKRGAAGNLLPKCNKDGSPKTKLAPAAVVWSKNLAHKSMLVVDSQTNQNYYHAIPKQRGWVGARWSLIFRTIA